MKLVWAWFEFLLATGLLLALLTAPAWAPAGVTASSPAGTTIERSSR